LRHAAGVDGWVRRWMMPVLVPASWLYQGVSNAFRSSRDSGRSGTEGGARVISVGNLEVGGGGKTPLAMKLLETLAADGERPVYVSRGFGGEAGRLDVVTAVPGTAAPATGKTPAGVRVLRRDDPRLASLVGDEGAMVAIRLPGVPLLFCRHKADALAAAGPMFAPTHAVMDDAFQSWGVARDVDIVLVDGARPFGDGWCLPAGRLREPPEALERADYVGVSGVEDEAQLSRARRTLEAASGVRKPVFGIRRRIEIASPGGGDRSRPGGKTAAALSAIARPGRFERQLAGEGVDLRAAVRYPDHHLYSARDLEWIVGEVDRIGLDEIVTTEKDWAKLARLDPPRGRFRIARLSLELFGEDPIPELAKAAE